MLNLSRPNPNLISIICIVGAVGLSTYIFAASRNDPGLRMAALVSSTSIAAALMATASTMLVGKSFTGNGKTDPEDLPPGSAVTNSEKVQTPPVTNLNAVADAVPATEPQP